MVEEASPSVNPPLPSSIDTLLERYLTLLDEYMALRSELSRLQTACFQHLARANFAAERGVRYGADFYDQRMRAVRTVAIAAVTGTDPSGPAEYRVVKVQREEADEEEEEAVQSQEGEPDGDEQGKAGSIKINDPLRWFGILTPLALRQTQSSAVEAVERVIPRLVTVDAEMRALEIEVRRARKKRAKAEEAVFRERQLAMEKELVDSRA